jgi:hypothetical protein
VDIHEFEQQLKAAKFFEGYSESAKEQALQEIRKNFSEGMAGEQAEYFEKYPGLSLRFFDLDGELDGPADLEFVVEQMGKGSFGMFTPTDISAEDDDETLSLTFTVNGKTYAVATESSTWMPDEILQCIFKAMKENCDKNYFNSMFYPNAGQTAMFTLCSDRAMKALIKKKLLPAEYNDVPDGW